MANIYTTVPPRITNSKLVSFFDPGDIFRREAAVTSTFKTDDDIVFFFDEPVIAAGGDIIISSDSDTRHINISDTSQVTFVSHPTLSTTISTGTAGLSSVQFTYQGISAVIVNPLADLLPNATYTVQMDDGALADSQGNALAGFNAAVISTTNADPELLAINLHDGFTDFEVGDNIILTFDETVVAGLGDIVIRSDADIRTIDVTDASQVSFEDNGNVTINPQQDLIPDTVYTLQIPDGAVVDIDGNIFTGFSPATFTPSAGIAPQLLFSNPDNGSELFRVDDNIELNFDETVIAGIGNIVFSNGSDVRTIPVNDTSQVIFDEKGTVIIDPSDDLLPNETYTVQLPTGAITDQSGNAYPGFDNATFSTIEAVPLPFNGTIIDGKEVTQKSDENIVFVFKENKEVIAGSGNINFSNGSDTRTIAIDDTSQVTFNNGIVTIDLNEDLDPNTTYTVQIDDNAIIDTEGNSFAGIDNALLTTIGNAPLLENVITTSQGFFKADGDFLLTFDEFVVAEEGNIILSNGSDVHTIAIDDTSQVTFLGDRMIINPSDDLSPGLYTGTITSGAITDRAGNAFAGINDAAFTVIDSNPRLIGSKPLDGATNFGANENIMLFFDEIVEAGSGSIILSNGTDVRTIDINDTTQVTFDVQNRIFTDGTVIIDPTTDLLPGTRYTIEIANGVITDTQGNPYAGFSDASFTPTDPVMATTVGANPNMAQETMGISL